MAKTTKKTLHPQFIIGYARKSTDERDKQLRSIPDQIQDIEKTYAGLPVEKRRHPLRIMQEAASAYIPNNRPIFKEILDMANRGEVARVIVYDPTRLSRNPADAGTLMQLLADGILPEIITVNGNCYSRADTTQIFMLMVESGMSWKSSADTGWKVKNALEKKAKKGEMIGLAPLGYENKGDMNGKRWVEIDHQRSPIVQRLFALAATGAYSLEELTKTAKQIGLATKGSPKRPKGPVSKNSITNMIKNPFYRGYIRYKGEVFKGIHESLIDNELWQRANIRISERARNSGRTKRDRLKELFIMRGVLRCGKCGRGICFYQAKKGRYIMGECKNPKTKCGVCINQDKILAQLEERLCLLELENGADTLLRKDMKEVHERELSREIKERAALEKEYGLIQIEIGDLFLQLGAAERHGVLDAVEAKLATLKMRKEELQKAIQKLHNEGNDWIDHVIQSFELAKLASEAIRYGSPEVREGILKALGSNYTLKDGKLVWELPSPFREKLLESDRTNWGERWGLNPRPTGPQPVALTN